MSTLTDRVASLELAVASLAGRVYATRVDLYSEDQPRDDHGRFGGGGGEHLPVNPGKPWEIAPRTTHTSGYGAENTAKASMRDFEKRIGGGSAKDVRTYDNRHVGDRITYSGHNGPARGTIQGIRSVGNEVTHGDTMRDGIAHVVNEDGTHHAVTLNGPGPREYNIDRGFARQISTREAASRGFI